MSISTRLDRFHLRARSNRWLWYFAIFNRIALAAGFIPSGMVKILGERFTALPVNHPMGSYLEALYYTDYYYTFIGVMQVTAAILLLIPRTAVLGAFIYFPIILNICVLSLAVRFEGSWLSSPLMVLSNLYLLGWYYHKWKFILPFNQYSIKYSIPEKRELSDEFPVKFFAGVFITVVVVVAGLVLLHFNSIMPRNHLSDCRSQCEDREDPEVCYNFCECIHTEGRQYDNCLDEYYEATD